MLPRLSILAALLIIAASLCAQRIPVPAQYPSGHPRQAVQTTDLPVIKKAVSEDPAARSLFEKMKSTIDPYVSRHRNDSSWIVSRLQMYWTTKASTVYIKGGVYDHADGTAPVPTVRFPGARDNVTVYAAPALKDLLPYSDDPRGVWLINRSKPGEPLEWAEIGKTGRTIESINNNIMALASQAAQVYWVTGDTTYGRFAFDLFDTYMTGLHYRSTPKDLNHGHHETIAGLITFEVIQETPMINHLTAIYDFLYAYLQRRAPGKMALYADVFRKWARVQIANGVGFNNWDLIEARNILSIASILEDDDQYPDQQGRQYFIHFVLNENAERQWSIARLAQQGYDSLTGLWNECPGYSLNVLGDFTGLVARFDQQYKHDLLAGLPIIKKAVVAAAEYLFPHGYFTAWGDSYYGRISSNPAKQLLAHAQLHGKRGLADSLTRYIGFLESLQGSGGATGERREGLAALLPAAREHTPAEKAGKITDYVSPVFSSPHVSYLALRNGFDSTHGLMVSLSGSKGNHMHAGGIAMELYGKGLVLAPEAGIGTSYWQADYHEYYAQFPAHNTVAVDGISMYPVMKSNHGFSVKANYPASGVKAGYFPGVSFGDLYFIEPETQSDQRRLIAVVRTSETSGYYVDVFRSRRRDGKDKMHDYFYHNMGQQFVLQAAKGGALNLQPTEELSFGGGHLPGYDYFWDKRSVTTGADVQAVWDLALPGRPAIQMNMWMQGAPGRTLFTVKAPKSKAISRMGLPAEIAELPLPTIVARQSGEAWRRPFVAIFEPSTAEQPKSIAAIDAFYPAQAPADFSGLVVRGKAGDVQTIFADASGVQAIRYNDKSCTGTLGIISEQAGAVQYLFLGQGKSIGSGGYRIEATINTVAALARQQGNWHFTAAQPVVLSVPVAVLKGNKHLRLGNGTARYTGQTATLNGQAVLRFALPAVSYTTLEWLP
ncbi:heparinase II/III family protein [Paraflavitalea pollutisoli]|uniref:heparinase II/III family protein n=1 Tax=Paraflavitalea pollutisoli TaxID=3034143 RepID=UPI0023ECA053|nr:heparinase II/III family protein [Paraflavitalea sp. H1-2-19X]